MIDGGNKDFGLDDSNAGDGENKVDIYDVDSVGDSNDDCRVNNVCVVDINGCDDSNCGDTDCKFGFADDLVGGYGDSNNDGDVDDNGVDSNIGNDANRSDGKVDCYVSYMW